MNLESENQGDPNAQLSNLRQVVLRSESAIAALQKLVQVANGKIRKLETETQIKRIREYAAVEQDKSLTGLKMFE